MVSELKDLAVRCTTMMTTTTITTAAAAAADPPIIMAVVAAVVLVMLLAAVVVGVPGSLAAVVTEPDVAGWPELVMIAV